MRSTTFLTIALLILTLLGQARADAFIPVREDPRDLAERGRAKKATGIALMVMGSLNLGLAISSGISLGVVCAPSRPGRCEFLDAALYGMTVGGSVVAAHLLATGIPIYAAGVRQAARARRIEQGARAVAAPGEAPHYLVEEPEALRHARQERFRKTGIALMVSGAVTLAAGIGLAACITSCQSRDTIGMLSSTLLVGSAGVALLATGGGLYRISRQLQPRDPDLRVMLGSTVGLAGTF